jgi:hypothetical protein
MVKKPSMKQEVGNKKKKGQLFRNSEHYKHPSTLPGFQN